MNNIIVDNNNNILIDLFSLKKQLNSFLILIGYLLIFSFGLFIGKNIILFWYVIAFVFFLSKKNYYNLALYLLFIFTNLGLYQYGFLGQSKDYVPYKLFDEYLILLLIITASTKKNRLVENEKKILSFTYPFLLVAIISGIINFVNPIDLFNYFLSTFRWLLILYIFLKLKLEFNFIILLFQILISILIISSLFGTLQTLILPIQPTPDGYVPHYLDMATGLLGATTGHFLTVLCLSFAVFYIFAYFKIQKVFLLLIIVLLLMQPFFSSSKVALFSISLIFIIFISFYLLFVSDSRFNLKTYFIILFIFLCVRIGMKYFEDINYSYFGNLSSNIENYLSAKRSIQDFQKVQGYFDAFYKVAPSGNASFLLGVGPTNFFSFVGLKNENIWLRRMGMLGETMEQSSTEFRGTDISGIIGELGIFGIITFFYMFIMLFSFSFKKLFTNVSRNNNFIYIFNMFYMIVILFYSFYHYGWFYHFFYLPFIILLIFQVKLSNDQNV